MTDPLKPTILCVASFFKGNEFIRECKRQDARVVLLTRQKMLDRDWARDSLDDLIATPEVNVQSYLVAATHLARQYRISRVVALEEYDILTAAHIREQLRIPGMGTTTARCFQDKLAMRDKARSVNIPQAEFVSLFNYEAVDEFMTKVPGPWMLKPRIGASSMGIKKLYEKKEVWRVIEELDARASFDETSSFHLLEQYIPGDVFHVDSLVNDGTILFSSVEHYCTTPFAISQLGGVNRSHTVKRGSHEEKELLDLNKKLLSRFGFQRGVTHAEFIRRSGGAFDETSLRECSVSPSGCESDEFFFLEVAARVGGAYTAETIEAATGINPWREWARIELATSDRPYTLPSIREDYGGIAVSLARQEHPVTTGYTDPEIVYRVNKPWHLGLVVRSPDYERVINLLGQYRRSFSEDFTAIAPPEDGPRQYV